MLTKKEKKRIIRTIERDAKFPNTCFCENRTWSNPIKTEMMLIYPCLSNIQVEQKVTTYKCEFCGKEYNDIVPCA
jgi:hypothetical protein